MPVSGSQEPPARIWYELEEALTLLADLEDGRDALIQSNQLVVVVRLERQIRNLRRKLGFDS